MKKLFKIFIIVLAVILLLGTATSVLASLDKADKDPDDITIIEPSLLEELGANIYYTGKYSNNTNIVIDGYLDDEAWIQVNDEAILINSMNSFMDKTSDGGYNGNSDFYLTTEGYDIRYGSDITYYVAQDDDFIYIAIKDYMPTVDLDEDGTFNHGSEGVARSNYYFRFGFNDNDYSQQIVFRSRNYSPEYIGIADSNKFTTTNYGVLLAAKAVAFTNDGKYLSEDNNSNNRSSLDGSWYNIIEFKLDKASIRDTYKAYFDVELPDGDLNIWLGLSGHTYHGGDSSVQILRPLWGTFVPEAVTMYGLPSRYIPTRVVFGEE